FLAGLNATGECHSGSVRSLRREEGRPLNSGRHVIHQGGLLLSGVAQRLELDFRLLNSVETVKTLFQGGTENGGTGSTSSNSANLNALLQPAGDLLTELRAGLLALRGDTLELLVDLLLHPLSAWWDRDPRLRHINTSHQ